MKRKLYLILALCFALVLTACSANIAGTNNEPESSTQESTLPQEAPTTPQAGPYTEIISALVAAYPWSDDDESMVPEYPDLSYMYRRHDTLSDVGYALMDLDGNGQQELILSGIDAPFVYDLFTVKDGKVVQLFSSGDRYSHTLLGNGYVENSWSGSAVTTGHDFYRIEDGTLTFIERITMDGYHALDIGIVKDESELTDENSFFRSGTQDESDYVLISLDEALERIDFYQKQGEALNIQLTPLAE